MTFSRLPQGPVFTLSDERDKLRHFCLANILYRYLVATRFPSSLSATLPLLWGPFARLGVLITQSWSLLVRSNINQSCQVSLRTHEQTDKLGQTNILTKTNWLIAKHIWQTARLRLHANTAIRSKADERQVRFWYETTITKHVPLRVLNTL